MSDDKIYPESGEDADSLYAQGMAHYRRREWQAAKECFLRLKSIAPDRRGVDALLNEVDLFLQLAAMEPEREAQTLVGGEDAAASQFRRVPPTGGMDAERLPQGHTDAQGLPVQGEESVLSTPGVKTARRRPIWSAMLIILAVLVVAFAALYVTGILDPLVNSQRQSRMQVLVNQGRAALNVGDYDRAVQAFGEALALAPTNEEVKTWYAKAQRYQQLTSWYEQAKKDITAQRWDDALANLERIMAVEPTYRDTGTQVEFVKSQQSLDARFAEAKSYLEQGNWDEVIKILELLREEAASFKPDEVKQTLFYAYFQQGMEWLAASGAASESSLDALAQAIQSLDRALLLFPEDRIALEERRLADLYRQGQLFVNQKNWPQAVFVLQQIQSARPDYMGGNATSMLCASYLQLGDAYYAAGSLDLALQQYRNVLAVEGCDHVDAAVKEREVYTILYPPTPTPTSTRTPTRTPRPVPTRTPTPTAPPPTATPLPPPPAPTATPRRR